MKKLSYDRSAKVYTNTSGNNVVNRDTLEAMSFKWWKYMKKVKNKVVFNDQTMSKTTTQHQQQARKLLKDLGIKIDVEVYVPEGLDSFQDKSLHYFYKQIAILKAKMSNPRSRPEANKKRKKEIDLLEKKIKFCRRLGARISREDYKRIMDGKAG